MPLAFLAAPSPLMYFHCEASQMVGLLWPSKILLPHLSALPFAKSRGITMGCVQLIHAVKSGILMCMLNFTMQLDLSIYSREILHWTDSFCCLFIRPTEEIKRSVLKIKKLNNISPPLKSPETFPANSAVVVGLHITVLPENSQCELFAYA